MKRYRVILLLLVAALLGLLAAPAHAHAPCDVRDHWDWSWWPPRYERIYLAAQEPIMKSGEAWIAWTNVFRNEATGEITRSEACYR